LSTARRRPKEHLQALGLFAKHHFGQNFLADEGLALRIAKLALPAAGITVVEIGAGLGELTAPLLELGARVVAIERDRDLIPALKQRFDQEIDAGRLSIREADAKAVDYFEGIEDANAVAIAGNLPYQITGPLLQRFCALAPRVLQVVVLVQLEVAERLTAKPGTAAYGALSVFVQAKFEATRQLVVRRGAFYPQPNVDSAVVLLRPHQPSLAEETPLFNDLVHRAFQKRRKQLRNAWRGVGGMTQEQIQQAASKAAIDLEQRGECLDVGQFWKMARTLEEVQR
jgi:16S rRNA (adenine1518-N6/adenine1519-N6)-dimethyltransferase